MQTNELYWAAGFFDGEGSTGVYKSTPSSELYVVRISIHQVEREPLERFQSAVDGVGGIGGPYSNGDSQPIHRYQITRGLHVRQVCDALSPLLCKPKREQMLKAISLSDTSRLARGYTVPVPGRCIRGHDASVYRKPNGQCRMCMRITDAKRHGYLTPEWIASWETEGGVPYTGWLRT